MHVVLRGLTKRFESKPVLADVTLELSPGQVVAVIGLNGAGKTTLLRCLAGVLVPSAGSIRWNDCDSIRDDMAVHRQMMFLSDTPLLIDSGTVVEHVLLLLRAYGRDGMVGDAEVIAMLRELDLIEHATNSVSTLSRGQRYKAALAALLLIRPELWLLDEPFASGMDPQGMHSLRKRGRSAVDAGACLVYSTQIIEIAERFCDVLLVIDRGRLAQRFTGEELRAMPKEGEGSLEDRLAAFREKA